VFSVRVEVGHCGHLRRNRYYDILHRTCLFQGIREFQSNNTEQIGDRRDSENATAAPPFRCGGASVKFLRWRADRSSTVGRVASCLSRRTF